jgi:hypothetical protein
MAHPLIASRSAGVEAMPPQPPESGGDFEIIDTVHARRAPMVPVGTSLRI